MPLFTEINSLDEIPSFEIVKEEVFDSRGVRVNNLFSLMRNDTRDHIGVCRSAYRPIQMSEMLDILDDATKRVGGIEHTGFTIAGNGKRVVVRSSLVEQLNINGDKIDGVFYTVLDNSGTNSNKIIPSTRRIVCDNQLHIVRRESAGKKHKGVRHSFTFDESVSDIITKFENNINIINSFSSVVEKLQNEVFTEDQMRHLIEKLIPSKGDPSTKMMNKREDIFNRFVRGIGNNGSTRWDALNAVTEFESTRKFTPEKLVRTLTIPTLSNSALEILTK
jgi:hypothetical protein